MSFKRFFARIILFTVFILPMIFLPFLRDPFGLPRVSVLRLATVVLLIGFLSGVLKFKMRDKKDVYVMSFLVLNFISIFFSKSPFLALWGRYFFYFGGFLQVFCMVVFYFAVRSLRREIYKRMKKVVIWVLFFVSSYAVMQLLNFDFVKWDFDFGRVFSTFGNPDFFAGFLVLAILFVSEECFKVKSIFSVFVYIFSILVLMFTKTRAGWLGFLAGWSLFLFPEKKYLTEKNDDSQDVIKNNFWIKLLPIILVLLFIFFGGRKWSPSTAGISSRLICWKETIKLISKKPVIGYGLESYAEVITEFIPVKYEKLTKKHGTPGYAHNIFLDITFATGIIGLGIFILILIEFFRQTKNRGLKSAVFGFLIFGLFSICDLTCWFYFWIFLGLDEEKEVL